jgi:superoxide dismutase|tara:strand:+ start:573 stop:860 length:288 start_codon:yes stop_codon:yes gene_type:complete
MGKITVKDATDLVKKGLLSEDGLKKLENENLVSKRASNPKKYVKSANGIYVEPMFYFKGLKKDGKYTKDMTKMRKEVNVIIGKYAVVKNNEGVSK